MQLTCIGRLSKQMFISKSHKQLLRHKWAYAYGLCMPPRSSRSVERGRTTQGQSYELNDKKI